MGEIGDAPLLEDMTASPCYPERRKLFRANGLGLTQDQVEAVKLFRAAAKGGYPRVMLYLLGMKMARGYYVSVSSLDLVSKSGRSRECRSTCPSGKNDVNPNLVK